MVRADRLRALDESAADEFRQQASRRYDRLRVMVISWCRCWSALRRMAGARPVRPSTTRTRELAAADFRHQRLRHHRGHAIAAPGGSSHACRKRVSRRAIVDAHRWCGLDSTGDRFRRRPAQCESSRSRISPTTIMSGAWRARPQRRRKSGASTRSRPVPRRRAGAGARIDRIFDGDDVTLVADIDR